MNSKKTEGEDHQKTQNSVSVDFVPTFFLSSERRSEAGATGMLIAGELPSGREAKAHLQIGNIDASVHSPPGAAKPCQPVSHHQHSRFAAA